MFLGMSDGMRIYQYKTRSAVMSRPRTLRVQLRAEIETVSILRYGKGWQDKYYKQENNFQRRLIALLWDGRMMLSATLLTPLDAEDSLTSMLGTQTSG